MNTDVSRAKLQRMRDVKEAAAKFILMFDNECETIGTKLGSDPLTGFEDSEFMFSKLKNLIERDLTLTDLDGKVYIFDADGNKFPSKT